MKVLLSIEERLLRRIDQKAKSRGLSRSAYLANLAESDIMQKSDGLDATLSRLDHLFANSPGDNATAAIRAQRDAR